MIGGIAFGTDFLRRLGIIGSVLFQLDHVDLGFLFRGVGSEKDGVGEAINLEKIGAFDRQFVLNSPNQIFLLPQNHLHIFDAESTKSIY